MSVNLESAARLNALKQGIEATTGESYPDLTGGVNALIAGFGQGGGLAYDMGEFVLDADVVKVSIDLNTNTGGIPHALGAKPDFLLIWTDDFADLSADNLSPYTTATVALVLRADGLTGMYQRCTSAVTATNKGFAINATLNANNWRIAPSIPTSASYTEFRRTETRIEGPQIASNTYYRAGITYKYFVSKAWWNTEVSE